MGSDRTPLESLPLLQAPVDSDPSSENAQLDRQQPNALTVLQQQDQLAVGVAPDAIAMQTATQYAGESSYQHAVSLSCLSNI